MTVEDLIYFKTVSKTMNSNIRLYLVNNKGYIYVDLKTFRFTINYNKKYVKMNRKLIFRNLLDNKI